MPHHDPKAVVRDVMAAAERGDIVALAAHPGLYETVEYLPHMLAALPDMRHTLEDQIVEGDMVATRIIVTATHRGPFMGVASTGRQVTYSLVAMDRVVDGTIVVHHATPSWLDIRVPLGALPGVF